MVGVYTKWKLVLLRRPVGDMNMPTVGQSNMLLTSQSLGLETLWFTLFEKNDVRTLFDIDKEKDPIAIICLGYPEKFAKFQTVKV